MSVFLPAASMGLDLVDVPLDHWSYEFLERFEIRGTLERSGLESRPLTRAQMAKLVDQLQQSAPSSWTPSRIEHQQIQMLADEFAVELATLHGAPAPEPQRAQHTWRVEDVQVQLYYRAGERLERGFPDPAKDFARTNLDLSFDPRVAVQLFDHFLVTSEWNYRLRSTDGRLVDTIDVRRGIAEIVFDPSDRFSITRSVLSSLRFGRGPVMVSLGRERLQWGPGRHTGVLLDSRAPPLDALRLQFNFGRVQFVSVNAQLRPGRLLPTDPDLNQRYLAAHRLQVRVSRRVTLGISEAVVYGNRGLDLAYVNPLTALFVTQANIGNLDNALAGVEGKFVLPNLELYFEVILDDLNLRRGLRHFGNKVALVTGFLWLQPFGLQDWDVDAEWSFASQYVYTHQIPINRYAHFGQPLGGLPGPDADSWTLGIRRRWTRGWDSRLFYNLSRRGQGALELDQDTRNSDQQEFLSGTVEKRHMIGLALQYRGLRSLQWAAEYRHQKIQRPNHNSALAPLEGSLFELSTRLEF